MRVGRIGYVNCYPVYGAIDRGIVPAPGRFVTGTPSELNDLLAAGELDVSVISAVAYARDRAAYALLPDLAISCDGPVRSVLLFTRRPIESMDDGTVLVSASSQTSVHLLELLCADYWGIAPRIGTARTERGDLASLAGLPHDGVLVIGDAALVLAARETYPHTYDLGATWKTWTGLPFVFAVWAARRQAPRAEVDRVHRALMQSRDWGLDHLDVLAAAAAQETSLPEGQCRDYLSGLDYALTPRHIEGLTTFFRRLADRGTVRDGSLAFLTVA